MEPNIDIELYNILSERNFGQLTPREKKFVLGQMTEEEYNELHFLQHRLISAFNDDRNYKQPSLSIKDRLVKKMEEKNADKKPGWLVWINYKLPVYQAAAACIIIGAMSYLLFTGNKKQPNAVSESLYSTIIDTLNPDKFLTQTTITSKDSGDVHKNAYIREEHLKNPVLTMDRIIPEIYTIQMRDLAYKSLAIHKN